MNTNYFQTKDSLVEEMKLVAALEHRTIYLTEDVDDEIMFKADYFIDRIIRHDKEIGIENPEPIKLVTNSYGGSIYDGLGLISKIEYLQENTNYEFHSEIPSYSMSMSSAIGQVCKYRTARRYATILYHTPLSSMMGSLSDMQTALDETHRLWKVMKQITMKHTKMTEDFLDDMFHRNKDLYMSVEDALKYGIIDEIL